MAKSASRGSAWKSLKASRQARSAQLAAEEEAAEVLEIMAVPDPTTFPPSQSGFLFPPLIIGWGILFLHGRRTRCDRRGDDPNAEIMNEDCAAWAEEHGRILASSLGDCLFAPARESDMASVCTT
ncbi:hypothetical protein BKA81DRAFT_396268 [Phyllosticta paracitricarpa]|uniref:Uncharacterized protein n=1 Tax=Phyllosticta citricarpa TaxID=55181 RepID=A0ABR1MNB1_9PEZI